MHLRMWYKISVSGSVAACYKTSGFCSGGKSQQTTTVVARGTACASVVADKYAGSVQLVVKSQQTTTVVARGTVRVYILDKYKFALV